MPILLSDMHPDAIEELVALVAERLRQKTDKKGSQSEVPRADYHRPEDQTDPAEDQTDPAEDQTDPAEDQATPAELIQANTLQAGLIQANAILTPHLQLVNADGDVCANLRAAGNGSVIRLSGSDESGAGIILGVDASGDSVIALETANRLCRLALQCHSGDPDALDQSGSDSASLTFMDGENKPRGMFSFSRTGTILSLKDARGKTRVQFAVMPDGDAVVSGLTFSGLVDGVDIDEEEGDE